MVAFYHGEESLPLKFNFVDKNVAPPITRVLFKLQFCIHNARKVTTFLEKKTKYKFLTSLEVHRTISPLKTN